MSEEKPTDELTDDGTPGDDQAEPIIELTEVVVNPVGDDGVIELTEVVKPEDVETEPVIELTDVVESPMDVETVGEPAAAADEPTEAPMPEPSVSMDDNAQAEEKPAADAGPARNLVDTIDGLMNVASEAELANVQAEPPPSAPEPTPPPIDEPTPEAVSEPTPDPTDGLAQAVPSMESEIIDDDLALPDDVLEAVGEMVQDEMVPDETVEGDIPEDETAESDAPISHDSPMQIGMDTDPNITLDDDHEFVASLGITIEGAETEPEPETVPSSRRGFLSPDPPVEAGATIPLQNLEDSLEQVVRRLFEQKIEGIIVEIVENAINKEMARLNTLLLSKGADDTEPES